MKPLPIAAALTLASLVLAPVAAEAQVAAGALPNTFDRPASAPVSAPAAAPAAAPTPANAASEDVLRTVIAGAQAGALDYALMTDDLAGKVREQEAAILPLIQGFGAVRAVDFVGNQNGADLFAVTFANAATEWIIGIDEAGKIGALLFRPAQ